MVGCVLDVNLFWLVDVLRDGSLDDPAVNTYRIFWKSSQMMDPQTFCVGKTNYGFFAFWVLRRIFGLHKNIHLLSLF